MFIDKNRLVPLNDVDHLTTTAESEPDADLAAEQLTIVVRKLPDPGQGFWKLPVAKSIRRLGIYI